MQINGFLYSYNYSTPPLLILLLLIKRTFKFLETKNVYSVHSVEQLDEP